MEIGTGYKPEQVTPSPAEAAVRAASVQEGKISVREVAQKISESFNASSLKKNAEAKMVGLEVGPKVSGVISGALEAIAGFVEGRSGAALGAAEKLDVQAESFANRAAGRVENKVERVVGSVDRLLETQARVGLGWSNLADRLGLPRLPRLENPDRLEAKAEKKSRKAGEMLRKGHTYAAWADELRGLADRMSGKSPEVVPAEVKEVGSVANEALASANARIAALEQQLAAAKAKLETNVGAVAGATKVEEVKTMF